MFASRVTVQQNVVRRFQRVYHGKDPNGHFKRFAFPLEPQQYPPAVTI